MVASKRTFEVGDLVFAKVKGYPYWPAKITLIDKTKHKVYFYGTGEIGNVKKEDMLLYEESKDKFSTDKFLKKKGFKEALMQIESALSGEDPSPLAYDVAAVQSGMDDTLETSQQTSISAAETTFNESRVSANSTAFSISKVKLEAIENDNTSIPQTGTATKANSNAKASATKKAVAALASATNNGSQRQEFDMAGSLQDATDTKEIVSQRGRKIKQKRFLDGEDEEAATTGLPPKRKTMKMTAKAPLNTTNKLDAFDKIEADKMYLLKLERQLVELNLEIKSSVKLSGADPERCIKLMEQYENLSVTPTILKKNPNCVETMKRLRKYVGNAKTWKLDDKQKLKFDFQAQLIRQKAEQIYARFKDILGMSDGEMPFWDWFVQEVSKFDRKTKHLTQEELYLLVDEKELEDNNVQSSNDTTNVTHDAKETMVNSMAAEEQHEGADEGFDPEATAPEESTTNVGGE